jgi:hypothetical protein
LIFMLPSTRKELSKELSICKMLLFVIQQEYNPVINVQYNELI